MAEKASAEQNASFQIHEFDPSTPQPQKADASELPDDESPRDRRRREWHTAKIEVRRAEQLLRKSTNVVDCSNPMLRRSPDAQTRNAPPSAYTDVGPGFDDKRPHNRTHSQWKTIQELQLCASCLTRTMPPHKPSDKRAPCKDRPTVPYEEADISAIRKELALQGVGARRKGNAMPSNGRKQKTHPVHSSSRSDKHTPGPNLEPNAQYGLSSHIRDTRPRSAGDVHNESVPFAPLYNFRDSDSYGGYHTALSQHRRYEEHQGAETPSSITLEHPEWPEVVSAKPPKTSELLQHVDPRPTRSPKQSAELDFSMLGLIPSSPSIPEIHIEGETELADAASHRIGLISGADLGNLMPRRVNVDRDWDSDTHVADSFEQTKLQANVDGDLRSSKLLVEKLLGEANAMKLSMDRSWTLKGLCPSSSSSEWDDATMVEEPQELSRKYDFFPEKVLRPTQSVESFFTTRQGTLWV